KLLHYLVTESHRIHQRVKRERVFGCSGRAKVIDGCPACKHEVVETDFVTIINLNPSPWYIDSGHRSQTEVHILLVSKHASHRRANVFGIEQRGGDLIKQRLKGVIVVSIDQSDIDGNVGQLFGNSQSAKPGADDYHVWFLTHCFSL